ncbi:hypothetical protein BDQ94DRAFT_177439 [Aspergillus welwitschiae]|uniref:Uncharacterized protein n=1 Tax=Aspergillus welwitschiae TaxID=1341132 RepID=A0A3F3PI27_9EURO|nr:hypothetical protein BDQ94DRAFT_177439 [Aspergillus welwitschiae]RDH26558.1 hypothetical protein BDQ94DRAFT_177439 [Aspergillus welwitschiae]
MQKNTLTGVGPPAKIKAAASRAPSRKPRNYPHGGVTRARFYQALYEARLEVQRLEGGLWSQNHAGSILRQLCRLQSTALARARRLAETEWNRPLREPMENMEALKCDRCGTKALDVVLAPCFHSLCPGCGGAGAPGASEDMFKACYVCSLHSFQQPRRT